MAYIYLFIYLFIFVLERGKGNGGRENERERYQFVVPLTDVFFGWFLILVCALAGDQTHNLPKTGWRQLSYLARATRMS